MARMIENDEYDITVKQVATRPESSAMRLDRPTEDRLYKLYRNYFTDAERNRNWNPWTAIPWDEVKSGPSPELVAAALEAYREDLFMPDYSARALHLMRASRGRAWFITRWSYEEGKHLLALHEWLLRSGAFTDEQLKELAERLLTAYRWEPPFTDAPAVFVDSLLWELREIERAAALKRLAGAAGDTALVRTLELIQIDEAAQKDFFVAALGIIAETYPDVVRDAIRRVTDALEVPNGATTVFRLLDLAEL
jgi:acyl-[acyl-carrier-protein] desaturase